MAGKKNKHYLTNNKYYFTVSVGQEYESELSGYFWLRVCHETEIKLLGKAGNHLLG